MTRDDVIETIAAKLCWYDDWPDVRESEKEDFRDTARIALSALEAAGIVIVPIEPTPEAVCAWYRTKNGWHFHDDPPPSDTSDYAAYRALVRAASLRPQEPTND